MSRNNTFINIQFKQTFVASRIVLSSIELVSLVSSQTSGNFYNSHRQKNLKSKISKFLGSFARFAPRHDNISARR
jgi:hypothetical protein